MSTVNTEMEPIDFVITWVDGADSIWKKQKEQYQGISAEDDCEVRYRDWDVLKYWFRGVEKYAPWVRKIHFVTWGHLPAWLDTENPKLHVVRHEDYIPKEYLPCYNSNVLEIYMHKIEGLSERFVYFNDDVYLLKSIEPEYFFKAGKPCDMLAFQPVVANPKNPVMSYIFLNNSLTLCKYFKKRENVKQQPRAYFAPGYPLLYLFYNFLELFFPLYTGFYTVHNASPFLKATFEKVWEKEEPQLRHMSENRFRNKDDVSQYLFREWQKLSSDFVPTNIQKSFCYFAISENNQKLCKIIEKQKKTMLCINDTYTGSRYEQVKKELQEAFEKILPEVSSFER